MSTPPRTIIVTGAAGALGRAAVAAFLAEGSRVAGFDLSEHAFEAAWPTAPAAAAHWLAVPVDLTDAGAVAAAVARVQAWGGTPAALVNIAGGFAMGDPVHATDDATWARLFDLNVTTLRRTVAAVVPAMQAAGQGCVVNVGANGALRGTALMGAYTAAKATVVRLTEAMAEELGADGINVNCVLPGVIDTPANRAAMPEADPSAWVAPADLAAVIRFLASPAAGAVQGAAVPVTGRG